MKHRIFLLCTLFLISTLFSAVAQNATIIKGKILNNTFRNVNVTLSYSASSPTYGSASIDENGYFTLTATVPSHDIYRLNFEKEEAMLIALAPGEKIDITIDAANLQNIISVSGSKSMNFVKAMADNLSHSKFLIDSITPLLQNDETQKYYNNFFQQFNLYAQTNNDVDDAISGIFKTLDSLKTLKSAYFPNNKIKGELDLFLSKANTYLKNMERDYTIFDNYQKNVGNYYNFKSNRLAGKSVLEMTDNAAFYSTLDLYLKNLETRHAIAKEDLTQTAQSVSILNKERDSLVFNNLLSKDKAKKIFIQKIILFTDNLSDYKTAEKNYSELSQNAKSLSSGLLSSAQQNVSNTVKYYQNMYNKSVEQINIDLRSLIIANKDDISVLMFLDQFPIENNAELHKEVITSLNTKYSNNPLVQERVKQLTAQKSSTEIGAMAPELAFANPDGKIMKLSDLRGKVVLIDFWASWCRPCRGENPNVVKLYNKYKDKGFEVFSVSLDGSKDAWVAAIAADKLSWPNHVSDLKKWSSEGAKIYDVRSIPATFLVGKDGKIIAKNLRGDQLAKALKEIFGE